MEMEIDDDDDRRSVALGNLRVLPDEILSSILTFLSPRDVATLACVSSVMYIFCNEEPLWMTLCLKERASAAGSSGGGLFQYRGSWKKTLLLQENAIKEEEEVEEEEPQQKKQLYFDGFNSLFLYKRMYRCYTTLDGFTADTGNVRRASNISLEEFRKEYDGKKPVMLSGLTDTWPARSTWTLDQLSLKYGDTPFKISQRSARKIKMKLKDYISYMKSQHDEDPLYIFDEKFGETAPDLLKDYEAPHLFQEDFFDVLNMDQRPAFRWVIIGPERSGASWHVDPALTSAWNTLLCGRKRWALYPPGKVPLGVTVHVNDEDGDVNIDTPTSLQWWLEFYPLLPDEDKPIECTQLPGETIFVPSGWWHCVLNLEPTVAVTQNFVNTTNFEFVCLDFAPGYRHKGVCRAGFLALDDQSVEDVDEVMCCSENGQSLTNDPRKDKRPRLNHANHETAQSCTANCCNGWKRELPYEINFLSKFLDEDRDHYNSFWSSSNCIGQREMRDWLWKLWIGKPGLRDLIWKGACLALNAGKLLECVYDICKFHNLPFPAEDEKLPVGTGSNPVFLIAENVVKIYVEGGLESCLYGLGTELEFYHLLSQVKSPLKDFVPDILASGLISLENGTYTIVPWDGKGIPDSITGCEHLCVKDHGAPFGVWRKKMFELKNAQMSCESNATEGKKISPYVVTRRCKGKIFAELRETLSWNETVDLASFLGEQLHNIRKLPLPKLDNTALADMKSGLGSPCSIHGMEIDSVDTSGDWKIFFGTLATRKKDLASRLSRWGDPIPSSLVDKVYDYLPQDFGKLVSAFEEDTCSWIHSDIMDDNIYMEATATTHSSSHAGHSSVDGLKNGEVNLWKPSYILDFSNLSVGDCILDLIPIHIDIFKGDPRLMEQLLSSYKLPLLKMNSKLNVTEKDMKFIRTSYRAMCYCILHEENVIGAIFSMWPEFKTATSWEEIEEKVWGVLNGYMASS